MAPCALIHYLDSNPGALPKCFKEGGYLDIGLLYLWTIYR